MTACASSPWPASRGLPVRPVARTGHRCWPGSLPGRQENQVTTKEALTVYAVITRADIDTKRPDEAAAMLTGRVVPATKGRRRIQLRTLDAKRGSFSGLFCRAVRIPRGPQPPRRIPRAAVLPGSPVRQLSVEVMEVTVSA